MQISTKWEFGDKIYMKTDPNQDEFLITGIIARPGSIILKASNCGAEVEVYEFEVTRRRNRLKQFGADKETEDDE